MSLSRLKDINWCPGDENGQAANWERVQVAVLLDIRDRLDMLRCAKFLAIPERLSGIERHLKALRRERCHRKHVMRGSA